MGGRGCGGCTGGRLCIFFSGGGITGAKVGRCFFFLGISPGKERGRKKKRKKTETRDWLLQHPGPTQWKGKLGAERRSLDLIGCYGPVTTLIGSARPPIGFYLGTLPGGGSLTPEPAQAADTQEDKRCQERQAQEGAQDDASDGPGAQGGVWKRQSEAGQGK